MFGYPLVPISPPMETNEHNKQAAPPKISHWEIMYKTTMRHKKKGQPNEFGLLLDGYDDF